MRILFDNAFERATISSLYPSNNYPPENLIHPFLEKRYQPYLQTSDTLTFEFDSNEVFDCLFFGYHTMTAYEARFYDGSDVLLLTLSISSPPDIEYRQFSRLTTVRRVEIDVTFPATGSPYIGGIGGGEGFFVPYFLSDYDLPVKDTSAFVESSGGQTLQIKRTTLDEFEFTVPDQTLEYKNGFMAGYRQAGKGKPLFLAPFSEGVSNIAPLYGKFTDTPDVRKSGRRFSLEFKIREAR